MDPPEFHRLAEYELNEAARYYDREEPGLGGAFLEEADRCLRLIQEAPQAGAIVRGTVRRRLLRRFPYALLYKIEPNAIRILAVMNLRRLAGARVKQQRQPNGGQRGPVVVDRRGSPWTETREPAWL